MENGWIRVNSPNVAKAYNFRICVDGESISRWLPQANHIFDRLNITQDLENYVFMDSINYWLEFSASTENLPLGYLFLCPSADLQDDFACFRLPVCLAYWSLDPSGAGRLTADEARTAGFPDVELRRAVLGTFWDDSVYTGIRQFHEAKGFDPYSQDAAIAMGCPLIDITCDRDALVAHIKANGAYDEFSDTDVDEYHDFAEAEEDCESTSGSWDTDQPMFSSCDEAGTDDESVISSDHEPDIHDVDGKRIADSCSLDAEMFAPSLNWNIIMSVQFALLFILGLFSLYDSLHAS
ncbi:hypothetical protein DFH06DRAFT_1166691 [Mycena polygramma]|nr:hypothetical protein DFH06DRAFT_1166691 [Mycena polygramma]